MIRKLIYIFVSVAISVALFYMLMPMAEFPRHYDGNPNNLFLFALRSHHPVFTPAMTTQYLTTFPMWENRFGGALISGAFWDVAWPHLQFLWHSGAQSFPAYEICFALYNVLWIFGTFLLFVWLTDNPLFYVGLTTCGLLYNFGQQSGAWYYTWDMPSLFWFTLCVLLALKEKWKWLMPAIVVGSFFKETIPVMAISLFWVYEWKAGRKLIAFLTIFSACAFFRIVADHFFHVRAHAFAGSATDWRHNLTCFWTVNSFAFLNCGTVLLLFFLPVRFDLKLVAFVFLGAQFLYGHFDEVREYYELLPIGLVGLANLKPVVVYDGQSKRWPEPPNTAAWGDPD